MDILNDILYHLSCPSCGADWWDKDAFPSYCPYCNVIRDSAKYVQADKFVKE
jgi:rubrerythrin